MRDLISNQLVKYLEARGVEHIFGLCGHTNIAVLAALAKSRIKFVNTRHEQIAAHAADGYARAKKTTSVLLSHLGPGLTNAATGDKQVKVLDLGLGVLMALIAIVGFWPRYFGPLVFGTLVQPLLIHVHATVFSGWLVLFFLQAYFAATKRIRLHLAMGKAAIWYGVLLVVVGLALLIALIQGAGWMSAQGTHSHTERHVSADGGSYVEDSQVR